MTQVASSAEGPARPTGERLPAGGLRLCLRQPALLGRWILSRRFRRAVEVRKHIWKIRCFQKDELSPPALAAVDDGIRRFDSVLRSGPGRAQLDAGMSDLETVAQKWLRPYANAAMRENVEVFLVAVGVAMAIRTFFLQPFKIPTGSMQPTLYGVHFEDFSERPEEKFPGFFGRVFSALAHGDFYHELIAEADGVVLKVEPRRSLALIKYQDVFLRYHEGGRAWDERERIWFSPVDGHGGDLSSGGLRGVIGWDDQAAFMPLRPGRQFRKGEALLRLKDSTGDHLFVDRVSYNFRRPQRGEIIVFETRGIAGLEQEQFYIKRLVATGGETVRILDDRHLVINGRRLDASTPHFEKVYRFDGPPADSEYSGHVNGTLAREAGKLPLMTRYFPNERAEVRVGEGRYMVMGDNTLNSYDSRGWGDFSQTNVVGKYCFVWWPFTSRWGARVE